MAGQRLEVETHIVTGRASFLQNAVQCAEKAGIKLEALVLEPIATAEAVTTADERDMGVVLIDIGGGTSDLAVFVDGSIVYTGVLPVGGNHVTRDIAIGLRTAFELAEQLKIESGAATREIIPHGEALEVTVAGSGERLRIPRSLLGEIIEARMSELFELAREMLDSSGVQKRLPGGMILGGRRFAVAGRPRVVRRNFPDASAFGLTARNHRLERPGRHSATCDGRWTLPIRLETALRAGQSNRNSGDCVERGAPNLGCHHTTSGRQTARSLNLLSSHPPKPRVNRNRLMRARACWGQLRCPVSRRRASSRAPRRAAIPRRHLCRNRAFSRARARKLSSTKVTIRPPKKRRRRKNSRSFQRLPATAPRPNRLLPR
jgi:cell division ATPase FtsA